MNAKVKKTLTVIANVLAAIIGVFVLLVAVSAITSASRGYPEFFGYTVYAVKTNSMKGENEDSFDKGALIFVKLLSDDEKQNLETGQIVTFKDRMDENGDGVIDDVLNTHRIIDIERGENGKITALGTKGDNAPEGNTEHPAISDVVGVYSSKINNLGSFVLFVQSPTGFLVTVVVPSILVVIYCAFLFIKNILEYNREKRKDDIERLREELKKEMEKESK